MRHDSFICDMTPYWCFLTDIISVFEIRHVFINDFKSHMNELSHKWMSHGTYEWVMSRMNESCHVWTSHVTYERVMPHMNESCQIWMSHVKYEWVMSLRTSHVTYEGVMSLWMSKIFMNESCLWNVSCHYKWVMSLSMSHDPMNESCLYKRGMSLWMGHVSNGQQLVKCLGTPVTDW